MSLNKRYSFTPKSVISLHSLGSQFEEYARGNGIKARSWYENNRLEIEVAKKPSVFGFGRRLNKSEFEPELLVTVVPSGAEMTVNIRAVTPLPLPVGILLIIMACLLLLWMLAQGIETGSIRLIVIPAFMLIVIAVFLLGGGLDGNSENNRELIDFVIAFFEGL